MNEKKKPVLGQEAVTDARTLGAPRMLILGLQRGDLDWREMIRPKKTLR